MNEYVVVIVIHIAMTWFAIHLFYVGIIMILVGHLKWQQKALRPKVVYKFVDEYEEDKHSRNQEDLVKYFRNMFQNNDII